MYNSNMSKKRRFFILIIVFMFLLTGCGIQIQEQIIDDNSNLSPVAQEEEEVVPLAPSIILGGKSDSYAKIAYSRSGAHSREQAISYDFNEDGIKDIIISSSYEDSKGALYVYSGVDYSLLYKFENPNSNLNNLSYVYSVVNDIDSDNVKDILVSAETMYVAPHYNTIFAISGRTGSVLWSSVVNETWYGSNFFQGEDVNLDGVDDIIVNSNAANGHDGMIWVLSGLDGTTIWTVTGSGGTFSYLTYSEMTADRNSDGLMDYVVVNNRRIRIISAADGSTLSNCGSTQDTFSAINIGDLNSDTIDDYITNFQSYSSSRGIVQAISGSDCSVLYSIVGENSSDAIRNSDFILGDINSDSVNDYIVFSPSFNSNQGKIYVISGADGSVIYSVLGSVSDGSLQVLMTTHDYNGDGIKEWFAYKAGTIGKTYVHSGLDGSLLYEYEAENSTANTLTSHYDNFDLDKDGVNDFVLIDEAYDNDRGKVYFYSGADGTLLHSIQGEAEGDFLGRYNNWTFADFNSDGDLDFLIGSSEYNTNQGKVYIYDYDFI